MTYNKVHGSELVLYKGLCYTLVDVATQIIIVTRFVTTNNIAGV